MKLANLLFCVTVSLPLSTVHAATILVTGSDLLATAQATYKLNIKPLSKAESIGKLICVIDHLDQAKAAQGVNNYNGSISGW
jgi:hypothetical protein